MNASTTGSSQSAPARPGGQSPGHSHPERFELHNEIHARPRQAVSSPHSVSHIALVADPDSPGSSDTAPAMVEAISQLCASLGFERPPTGIRHFFGDFGAFRLKWERHGEFDDLTVYREGCDATDPFGSPAIAALPPAWLDSLPGRQIAALHVAVLPAQRCERPERWFAPELTGALLGDGQASAYSDFHLGPDGFSRFLLVTHGGTDVLTGREVQRLIEIDVYRMMAMLAFPLARRTASELDGVERALATLVTRLETAQAADEPMLLRDVTRLAATVERIAGVTGFRFAAARAYHSLVSQRGAALRENRLPGLPTPTGFLERRFGPAMAFCESVAHRVDSAAERIARASALLRTRVEIEREKQNQEVLTAMNRRARLQLRLQQTVEGLSVAAITYYAVGLVGYLAKAGASSGLIGDADLLTGLSVIPVALLIAFAVRRVRERIRRRAGSDTDALAD